MHAGYLYIYCMRSEHDIKQSPKDHAKILLESKVPEPGERVVSVFFRIPPSLAARIRTHIYLNPGMNQRAFWIAAAEAYLTKKEK